MARLRIDTSGFSEAERRLAQLAVGLLDLRPFWPRVVPLFIGWMREQFETEGAFAGRPWAPLSPQYLAWKSRAYPGKGILYATGAMRRAASSPRREAQPQRLILTIRDPKLEYHQAGTDRMPARPLIFSDLPAVAAAQLQQAADDYVDDLARRLGL